MTIQIIQPHEEYSILRNMDVPGASHCEFGFTLFDLASGTRTFKRLRNVVWYLLMLDAGLRVGECCRLPMSACYFINSPVRNLLLSSEITKKSNPREIPVTDRLYLALDRYLIHGLIPNGKSSWDYLICGPHSHRSMSTRWLERKLREVSLVAIGRPVHPHILRHTFATKLLKLTNIRTVQELLGHKHLSSTQIYTHVNFDDKKAAIDSLGSMSGIIDGHPLP